MGNSHGKWSATSKKLENAIWVIRLFLICIGIGSCFALLKAAVIPYVPSFIVDSVPCIWYSGKILFSPPYVYIIVNCIIVAIAASNSFHHHNHLGRKTERKTSSLYSQKSELLQNEFMERDEAMPEDTAPVLKPMIEEPDIASSISGTRLDDDPLNQPSAIITGNPSKTSGAIIPDTAAVEEPGKNSPEAEDGNLFDEQEGDTLDSIWKAITEGEGKQPMIPLKKSDTWETAMRRESNKVEPVVYDKRAFRKSETFGEMTAATPAPAPLTVIADSIVVNDKSMGMEELNQRIEAFIRKNHNDMRLQREESARQFVEMVNSRIVRRR